MVELGNSSYRNINAYRDFLHYSVCEVCEAKCSYNCLNVDPNGWDLQTGWCISVYSNTIQHVLCCKGSK